jgi:hypothetical protein
MFVPDMYDVVIITRADDSHTSAGHDENAFDTNMLY